MVLREAIVKGLVCYVILGVIIVVVNMALGQMGLLEMWMIDIFTWYVIVSIGICALLALYALIWFLLMFANGVDKVLGVEPYTPPLFNWDQEVPEGNNLENLNDFDEEYSTIQNEDDSYMIYDADDFDDYQEEDEGESEILTAGYRR